MPWAPCRPAAPWDRPPPSQPEPVALAVPAAVHRRRATGRPRPTILLGYFSGAGENYYYGGRIDLEIGNTEVLARIISRQLSEGVPCDVHRIEAADPYSEDYDATVARNVREQDADARPAIANPLASIDGYDVVLLGSPIWNVRPPMIMHTFAESHDFTGKTVYPFTTHAMSGLGTAERDYAGRLPRRHHRRGTRRAGRGSQGSWTPAVASWLKSINLSG